MSSTASLRRLPTLVVAALVVAATPLAAFGQDTSGSTKTVVRKPYQGPLDVIMSSHLWTDVPTTKDFVAATHPDPKTLNYTSVYGAKDPDRPKPRDADGISALQAELEHDGQANERKAKPLGGVPTSSFDAADDPKPAAKPTRRARKTAKSAAAVNALAAKAAPAGN